MTRFKTNTKTGNVYPLDAARRARERKVRKAIKVIEKYLGKQRRKTFPQTIAFDWNGTVDARGTGVGIPIAVLDALKKSGKNVIVVTSSPGVESKRFMRMVLDQRGIPYTGDYRVLKKADMFVGDKRSDERRAGKYGPKFVYAKDFSLREVLPDGEKR